MHEGGFVPSRARVVSWIRRCACVEKKEIWKCGGAGGVSRQWCRCCWRLQQCTRRPRYLIWISRVSYILVSLYVVLNFKTLLAQPLILVYLLIYLPVKYDSLMCRYHVRKRLSTCRGTIIRLRGFFSGARMPRI